MTAQAKALEPVPSVPRVPLLLKPVVNLPVCAHPGAILRPLHGLPMHIKAI